MGFGMGWEMLGMLLRADFGTDFLLEHSIFATPECQIIGKETVGGTLGVSIPIFIASRGGMISLSIVAPALRRSKHKCGAGRLYDATWVYSRGWLLWGEGQ